MFKKRNQKGFTLAELLIVVAIIAVLVAIAIPIFTAQLENSREATDVANIRSAYAEIAAAALTDPGTDATATVEKKQTRDGWQNADSIEEIAGVAIDSIESTADTTVSYDSDNEGVIYIDGNEAKSSFQ